MSEAIEIYRTPEVKTLVGLARDPRPNKILLNYIKASAKQSARDLVKTATWERPLDSFRMVGADVAGSAVGLAGARLGGSLGAKALPGTAWGPIAGTILGGAIGGGLTRSLVDKGVGLYEREIGAPQILTHVDIMSERQSKLSDLGSAIGLATGVPLAVLAMSKGINPLAAIGSALGSAYLASKVGNGIGNMAGYILDRRENVLPPEQDTP